MPSRSERQRRKLEATKGHAWVKRHHMDKVRPKPAKRKKR
jgi:hypothetical protein